MKAKRIIPCLDTKNGRVVKGVNFVNIKDAGDIVELATAYEAQGADEIVLLDISASVENRKTTLDWIEKVAKAIKIPFTIGGGIGSVDDAQQLLEKGASKVSINSSAVSNPDLINAISDKFGKERLVVAIDAKKIDGSWIVVSKGGSLNTGLSLIAWAREVEKRGAGEILFTSMDDDGTKQGYPLEALASLSDSLSIPIIASGGAGSMEHFYEAFTIGKADAALAASVFHFGEISIPELKEYLSDKGILIQ